MVEIFPVLDEADELRGLEVFRSVWPHDPIGLEEARAFRESLRDHLDLLARVDGVVVGYAIAAIQPEWPELILVLMAVLPERRRRGAGSGFYEAFSSWAFDHGIGTMESVVADDDAESLDFWRRRGFAEDRHQIGLVLNLEEAPRPAVPLPEGVEIVDWAERPELAYGIYEVVVEAAADIPGRAEARVEPFQDWLAHAGQGAVDRSDTTLVAIAGDEVIGYATLALGAGDRSRTAYHGLTGVKRAWRGHGVARALKAAQIARAMTNGYEELRTRNDERNASIRRLNEDFGYRPTVGRIYLKGPVGSRA